MIKRTILLLTTAAIFGLSACSASGGNDSQALTWPEFLDYNPNHPRK